MPDVPSHHRRIRSFVLRDGRLTSGQQRAFDEVWPRWGTDFVAGQALDPVGLFGNDRPVWLEIGFGNGESLATLALRHPERNYLGIEVHRPGVGHLLLKIEELGLKNLRVIRHDAVEVLAALPDACLAGALLYFPDPWHKKKHHKRRILQPAMVDALARVIRPGGLFHAATDWEDYGQHMIRVLSASPAFENTAGAGQFSPRPDDRPLTRFERRGQRLGHGVRDLQFRRR
jgi:tRNA (guanine-N7-)-methyltransferase